MGHDHRNGFVGSLNGMMLVATPTCGFGSYGPAAANRAARLFEFDIRHPYSPRTQLLTFGELVGKTELQQGVHLCGRRAVERRRWRQSAEETRPARRGRCRIRRRSAAKRDAPADGLSRQALSDAKERPRQRGRSTDPLRSTACWALRPSVAGAVSERSWP